MKYLRSNEILIRIEQFELIALFLNNYHRYKKLHDMKTIFIILQSGFGFNFDLYCKGQAFNVKS